MPATAMRPSHAAAELIIPGAGGRPFSGSAALAAPCRTPRRDSHKQVEFGHAAGDHGLHWEGTLVVGASGQAQKLGVKPGWKIHKIDGRAVYDGNDISMRLQEAMWQWRSSHVSFITDTSVVRAALKEARIAATKAEEERVAKLAFEGNTDHVHMTQVTEQFEFQGYIDRPEERAITLKQLHRVINFAKEKCHRWKDTATSEESRTAGVRLNSEIMNMYHLHHWLIMPATIEKTCSFVELLTNQRQAADWCVSHWWGEPVIELVRCIECQANTRKLQASSAWWIAAFSIRQASAQDEVSDPSRHRLMKAMSAAQFKMLLVLDGGRDENLGPAYALNRLWCCYELAMFLDQPKLCLDIAVYKLPKPFLITNGFTEIEEDMEMINNGAGYKAKLDREKEVSLELIERTLEIKIQSAQASVSTERNRILNYFAGQDLHLSPIEEHGPYEKLNKRLQGLFAALFWRRVVCSTAKDANTHAAQQRITDVLRGDTWRKSLDLCLSYCVVTAPEEKLALLARSLPAAGIKGLRLDLKGLDLLDENLPALGGSLPPGLEELNLDLSFNAQISNFGITNFVNALPAKMRELTLGLSQTAVTPDFQDHRNCLEGLRQQIIHEAQKGSICNVVNLCPSPDRRVFVKNVREKI
mmetsp:Transcript_103846/g.206411  ORF Transcript_103846/g.206411 Transcript_103846/m.206411 type:complete len:641 (+) Transcript_103846:90-2012(+)